VTAGAVRRGSGAQAQRREGSRMANMGLAFVTLAAALGRHLAHGRRVELVTLCAAHVLLRDVHLVTTDRARALPRGLNIEPLAPRAT
jgi:hypothetical protein